MYFKSFKRNKELGKKKHHLSSSLNLEHLDIETIQAMLLPSWSDSAHLSYNISLKQHEAYKIGHKHVVFK